MRTGKLNSNYRHGMKGTRFYRIWKAIKYRCNGKNSTNFNFYGGRGIKCKWDRFIDFYNEMYKSYKKHVATYGENDTSIDRIDNDKDYSKENCRWATRSEQSLNRDYIKKYFFNNETKTLRDWAKTIGCSKNVLRHRLNYGWSLEKTLTTPIRMKGRYALPKRSRVS